MSILLFGVAVIEAYTFFSRGFLNCVFRVTLESMSTNWWHRFHALKRSWDVCLSGSILPITSFIYKVRPKLQNYSVAKRQLSVDIYKLLIITKPFLANHLLHFIMLHFFWKLYLKLSLTFRTLRIKNLLSFARYIYLFERKPCFDVL